MTFADPEILAITLLLPSIFGLALITEGYQELREGRRGWFSLVSGLLFLGVIVSVHVYMYLYR